MRWLPPYGVVGVVFALWMVSIALAFKILPRMLTEDEVLKKHFGPQWEKWAEKVRYKMIPGGY